MPSIYRQNFFVIIMNLQKLNTPSCKRTCRVLLSGKQSSDLSSHINFSYCTRNFHIKSFILPIVIVSATERRKRIWNISKLQQNIQKSITSKIVLNPGGSFQLKMLHGTGLSVFELWKNCAICILLQAVERTSVRGIMEISMNLVQPHNHQHINMNML